MLTALLAMAGLCRPAAPPMRQSTAPAGAIRANRAFAIASSRQSGCYYVLEDEGGGRARLVAYLSNGRQKCLRHGLGPASEIGTDIKGRPVGRCPKSSVN